MIKLADGSVRLALPLDSSLGPLVTEAARSYLTMCHLPASASRFIARRIQGAVARLVRARQPVRAWLLLRSRGGEVRVALRVIRAGPPKPTLSPLARGAPPGVRAEYRPGKAGGLLTFTATRPDRD
ncbi:MAG TPA: hypothetical protein VGR67_12580 [Candidatus Polarisedimenticolia bacterium]|jgi:hypothetical protein|nr:hypothetical protein [Candidatus Polarisedimenticolia bacterium]